MNKDKVISLAKQAGGSVIYPLDDKVKPDSMVMLFSALQSFYELVLNEKIEQPSPVQEQQPVHPRHPVVVRWRNDGIEACAGIADAYGNTDASRDMRAMITAQPHKAEPAPVQEPAAWCPMDTAPKDGTLVLLLVEFEHHATEDDPGPHPTIGSNTSENDEGPDEWQFAGWNWDHDHYTQGVGTPVGWLPMTALRQTGVRKPDAIGCTCSVCGEWQRWTPSGMVCKNGHGGAPGVNHRLFTVPQPAQQSLEADGPDYEDGPDEEGFSGPRPWNSYTTEPDISPRQAKLLATALGECILASGIVRKDVDGFTGPQLLLFAEDLKSMLTHMVKHNDGSI